MLLVPEVIHGDITKVKIEAIVNAANTSLLGGGGVDGAIHRVGGSAILEECRKIRNKQGGCKVGEAVLTTAGKLPAKFVIHAVGPVWNNGKNNEDQLLASTYTNCLKIAIEENIKSIAFPNISTGTFRFPKERAAQIAIDSVIDFTNLNNNFNKIVFVCHDIQNYLIYTKILERIKK